MADDVGNSPVVVNAAHDIGPPRGTDDQASDGAARLLRLASVAASLGSQRVEEDARALADRIAEGRLYVACIGQFKRGKSTLINALIGDSVLPVGFTPVTAVPTVIRYGRRAARVQIRDGAWRDIDPFELRQYVSEECNPENTKGIRGVEVFVPSHMLSGGMCFVDTPGLGSVFTGNTAATQAFIPHIDAALVVIGADPPLAGEELSLVQAVGKQVANLVIVLNKADKSTAEEKAAAIGFAERQLRRSLGRNVGPVFEVSAAERLAGQGAERDWPRLLDALHNLVEESGRDLIHSACERGINRLSEQLLAIIGEEREALQRPIEESEQRIASMKVTISEAERSMRELVYLFMAEQQRLSDSFVDRHKTFVAETLPAATEEFDRAIAPFRHGFGPAYRRRIMNQAQDVARSRVLPWLRPEQAEGEREYRQVSQRFVRMANDFLNRLAAAGVPELARLPHALDPETGFRIRSRFTFQELIELAQPASPLRWMADCILVMMGARKVITKEGRAFLERLVVTNSTRVQSDVLDRVQESRSRLEVEIRKLLHEVTRVAVQALNHAKTAREQGAPAVEAARKRLATLESSLEETRL
jgi:GTP-binding protein EngB required for normal cell division